MRIIESAADIEEGLAALAAAEPRFAKLLHAIGPPPLRRSAGGLEAILRIVMDQQISLRAGAAIWRRLESRYAPFDAPLLAGASEADLKACGLSGAKIRTLLALSRAVAEGSIDFDVLHRLPDAEAARALIAIPGIGPWTVDIYLLTCLGRADAWPKGDLALQEAVRLAFGLTERPKEKTMLELAEPWRPWRAVAARLLWSYYRQVRGLPAA